MLQDLRITGESIKKYEDLIPEDYADQIRREELYAVAIYEGKAGDASFVGLSVEGIERDWVELVWLALGRGNEDELIATDLIRHRIRDIRQSGRYRGIFSEICEAENAETLNRVFQMAGFEVRKTKSDLFEFSLCDVGQKDKLKAAALKQDRIVLSDASAAVKAEAEQLLRSEQRPLPIPEVLDLEHYHPRLSFFSVFRGQVTGVFLVSKIEEYFLLELAYGADSSVFSGLFGNALLLAEKVLTEKDRILAPAVVRQTRKMLEKLVPKTARHTILKAELPF